MPLPKELTTVTKLSKTLALIIFLSLPIIAFLFGMKYQMLLDLKKINSITALSCTQEVKICLDGTAVGRQGPNCQFAPCPENTSDTISPIPVKTRSNISACINHLGEPQAEEVCKNIPKQGRSCETNVDCRPSCAFGCLNADWQSSGSFNDCTAEPEYSCECINSVCQSKPN